MKINEIVEARKKKVVEPQVPYHYGWDQLNMLKEIAASNGRRLSQSYQLFVPRRNPHTQTPRDRRLANLSNPWAWDKEDPTQLKPEYDKWEQGRKDLSPVGAVDEAAPLLTTGKPLSPPGNNKPSGGFWTSTAHKKDNGWMSDWSRWVAGNQPEWLAPKGYLYKVKPGALILGLDSDHDAERIFTAFQELGRVNEPADSVKQYGQGLAMRTTFPWDQVIKHFDGVWHGGYAGYGADFVYGWDVESTVWFNTDYLQLAGEVPVIGYDDDD